MFPFSAKSKKKKVPRKRLPIKVFAAYGAQVLFSLITDLHGTKVPQLFLGRGFYPSSKERGNNKNAAAL